MKSQPLSQKFIFYQIIIVILPFCLLHAVQWSGIVVDQNHQPLSDVLIFNLKRPIWTSSDDQGAFFLAASNQECDTIRFQRIGYHNQNVVLTENGQLFITMIPSPIVYPELKVSGNRNYSSPGSVFYTATKSVTQGYLDHKHSFALIPGLYIRSYGGPGGISSLSLDGAPSSHTRVLVAGFDLTNAQNGITDISQLPSYFIESVAYVPQNLPAWIQNKGEGSVYLYPWLGHTGFSASLGSYGHYSGHVNLNFQLRKWVGDFMIGRRYDDADYPAYWRGEKRIRQNNYFQQDFLALSVKTFFQNNQLLQLLYLYTHQNRGVAGQIWSPYPDAKRKDQLQILGSKYSWVRPHRQNRIQFLWRSSGEHYHNEINAINSHHHIQTVIADYIQTYKVSTRLEFIYQLESKHDWLTSQSTGNHYRWSTEIATMIRWQALRWLNISPGYQWLSSPRLYSESLFNLTVLIQPATPLVNSLKLTGGTQFQYPSFNDLYWKPGGNPALKPEHSRYCNIQINNQLGSLFTLQLLSFYRESDDLIQWTPVQSYWQPENILQAKRFGYKVTGSWQGQELRIPLEFTVSYNFNKTQNLTPGPHHMKPLRYAPENMFSASGSLTLEPVYLNFQVNHLGERLTLYSWPKDLFLPAVNIYSCSLTYRFKIKTHEIYCVFLVDNLTNQSYETIQGYPEPGRTWRLTVTYQFK